MKSVSRVLITFFIASTVYARPLIILSGRATSSEKEMIQRVLNREVGLTNRHIVMDFENKNCTIRRQALIQICFHHLSFYIRHQRSVVLRKTFKRLIDMNNQQDTGSDKQVFKQ